MSLCLCKELKTLKVEADMGADPLWCNECYANLEVDEFPMSDALKDGLLEWGDAYGTWIDWETDGLVAGGVAMEQQHNERGAELAEKVKLAMAQYEIVFSPSTFAKKYADSRS